MEFKTLETISIGVLTDTFNEAFKDYFVKIVLTKEILQNKITSEDIDLSLSAGAFEDGKIVGFILHGIREIDGVKTAYNAGTGVVEEARGQGLTVQIYQFIKPKLKKVAIQKCVLEVIAENTQAIKSYKNTGFTISGVLECFKGIPTKIKIPETITFNEIGIAERLNFQTNWNWKPTWQHANETIAKTNTYVSLGIFEQKKLLGYCSFNPHTGRIVQFCIEKQNRRNRLGTMLFSKVAQTVNGELSVINVDGNANDTLKFIEAIGLNKTLKQYAMELSLKNKHK